MSTERTSLSTNLTMVDPCPKCGLPVRGGEEVARARVGLTWWHAACYEAAGDEPDVSPGNGGGLTHEDWANKWYTERDEALAEVARLTTERDALAAKVADKLDPLWSLLAEWESWQENPDPDDDVESTVTTVVTGLRYALNKASLTPGARPIMGDLSRLVLEISSMIDATYPPGLDTEAHRWRRCAKVVEEVGEVTEALLGLTGENPRKGFTHELIDVREELFDVALAALGAVAHLDRNSGDPIGAFTAHARGCHDRLSRAIAALTEGTEGA